MCISLLASMHVNNCLLFCVWLLESFSRYFGKFGEITDSVIMMDKISGRPRGFGFVTFSDPEVANKVLEEEHVIDGRTVGYLIIHGSYQ